MKCLGCGGAEMRWASGGEEREWFAPTKAMVAGRCTLRKRRSERVGVAYFRQTLTYTGKRGNEANTLRELVKMLIDVYYLSQRPDAASSRI